WQSSGIEHAGVGYYSRSFSIDNKHIKSRYWIKFDAVDYESAVSVNGKLLNRQTGYFIPLETEISHVISEGDNDLNVWVNSPDEPLVQDWSLHKSLVKGVLNHHDTRPGGAWSDRGQDMNSGGIWGSVNLRETGPIAITQLKALPTVIDAANRTTGGQVSLSLDSRLTQSVVVELSLTLNGEKTAESYRYERQVKYGKQDLIIHLPQTTRKLWWPWDWGKPNLYQLEARVLLDGHASDVAIDTIGFRKVQLDEQAKRFYINDKPYFIRGTNYIASQWLGEVTSQDYQDDLALMREANINSVRVHAHVAGQSFYDAADKAGIIVWQDFPLQWGYSDDPVFIAEASRQAHAMTELLYNHPSIAFWCGHNEPPWDATWMQYKYESYRPEQNLTLTENVYQQLQKAQDGRVVRKASYTYEHPWLGWYSGHFTDYATYQPSMIVSEFGAQAMPSWAIIEDIVEDVRQWPLSSETIAELQYHNYQPHETLKLAAVQQGESLSHFWTNSQEYQRVVTKFAAEHLRLNKDEGVAAIYQFMFVDSWPSITWSVMDVGRDAKPGYDALKKAYQPVLAVVQLDKKRLSPEFSLTIINDTLQAFDGAKIIVSNAYNDDEWVFENILIPSNTKIKVVESELIAGLSEYLIIQILDKQGNLISSNQYQPKDFKG
ncbi:glycoside hydrolase family 2 protein, partial [Photobacterium sanctipauli]